MTPAERAAAIAARARATEAQATGRRLAAAEENRRRYPDFAAWVDDLRRVFGDVRVTRFEAK